MPTQISIFNMEHMLRRAHISEPSVNDGLINHTQGGCHSGTWPWWLLPRGVGLGSPQLPQGEHVFPADPLGRMSKSQRDLRRWALFGLDHTTEVQLQPGGREAQPWLSPDTQHNSPLPSGRERPLLSKGLTFQHQHPHPRQLYYSGFMETWVLSMAASLKLCCVFTLPQIWDSMDLISSQGKIFLGLAPSFEKQGFSNLDCREGSSAHHYRELQDFILLGRMNAFTACWLQHSGELYRIILPKQSSPLAPCSQSTVTLLSQMAGMQKQHFPSPSHCF